ncbi:MAG TPA: carbamoyltransferase HypF, partial [Vicinamibacteria bacterium]|nr:carbamoyltransferase HypF [Vicinamibacteria bacterium]
IVALKGLGGFHLACDARDARAVGRLRERKRRSDRPFAVMFPELADVEAHAVVEAPAREALTSPRRPIVLLPRREGASLAAGVAPGLAEIGCFLPGTPLHHLLLERFGGPLVMTSGNLSEEPIAAGNEEALARLSGLADLFVLHDRDIHMRQDDSVVRVMLGRERVLRRARGFVPEAIGLGFEGPSVLAVGADLKNTLCLTRGDAAILSQHVGDLESYEARRFFEETRANLERLFRIRPERVAHDLHPGYHGTAIARRAGLPRVAVQHHHAHVASCLVDNERRERVIGVAWDGTGYGADGTVWGGEILIADLGGYERVGRIRPVPLPGGDAAVRQGWRMAVSHLRAAGLEAGRVAHPARAAVEGMIREGVNVVPTSSAGRLFDAVAALTGVRSASSYEGQAAMELEALAAVDEEAYPVAVADGEPVEIDPRPLVRAIVADLDRGESVGRMAGRFHASLAHAIAEACACVRRRTGLGTVALSGGCFQNRLLTLASAARLASAGFEVLLHARVPPGDGGIALGQAAVAAWSGR